jgi:hypothetical protein
MRELEKAGADFDIKGRRVRSGAPVLSGVTYGMEGRHFVRVVKMMKRVARRDRTIYSAVNDMML